jgi:hypothetical protein
MDPNIHLSEMRQVISEILAGEEMESRNALWLALLAQAMDNWLSKGGFLPGAWERQHG